MKWKDNKKKTTSKNETTYDVKRQKGLLGKTTINKIKNQSILQLMNDNK